MVVAFIVQYLTRACLHIINSNLILTIRKIIYDKLIHQPLEFYDVHDNAVGNLTALLASNVRELNGASTEIYVFIYCSIAGMIGGVATAFIFEWNLGFTLIFVTPFAGIT